MNWADGYTNNIQHHERADFYLGKISCSSAFSEGGRLKNSSQIYKHTRDRESEKDTTPQKYQPYASTTRPQLPLPDMRQSSVSAGTPQTAP